MVMNSMESYGLQFQIKVISTLINDKEFLNNVSDILNSEYFPSQAHKWIVNEILKYFNKYHTTPTLEVLKIEIQKIDNDVLQVAVKEQLKKSFTIELEDNEYVKEEFTNFCKNQKLKKALLESVDLLQGGEFDNIRNIIDDALKAGQDKNIGLEYELDVADRYKKDYRNVIPTPWEEINYLLQGGLGNGDLGIIFGGPGGGKSWTLVQLGIMAAQLGYTVLHYSLELGEGYVGRRYDACLTKISVNDVENHQDIIAKELDGLKGKIIIKEYPIKGASLNTLRAHVQKCESLGHKPDVIIIDYLDLLSGTGSKYSDEKSELDDVYARAKGWAKELNIPIWSASQVNRAGAKDNVIEGDKAAGSYNKLMIADFLISLSRQKEDKIQGTGRFHIMKNRYGGDGMSYFLHVNTEYGDFNIIEEYDEDNEAHNRKPTPKEEEDKRNLGIDKFDKEKIREKFFSLQRDV